MSLGELLVDDLIGWREISLDGIPRRVLLWLDPERWFGRLVELLAPNLEFRGLKLLSSDLGAGDSRAKLKLALLELEAGPNSRSVVYLGDCRRNDLEPSPDGSPPTLWGVNDYRYKGCVWGRGESWHPGDLPEPVSLFGWLQQHGIDVAGDEVSFYSMPKESVC